MCLYLEYISSAGIDLPDNLAIKTQARWQDASIPDLVGLDEEGSHLLIVESKFHAPLTSNQPASYIQRLPADKPAILLFVAPASRLPTLWQELISRCSASDANGQRRQKLAAEQLVTIRLNDKHILALTSWELLLADLQNRAKEAGDKYASADIWQLQSLCDRIDADAFQPLSEDEITSPTKMRIGQFRDLIDELATRLVDSGIVSIAGYRATPGPDYYKRYMSIHGFTNWCIEFNERYRQKFPPTNLWLTITETPQLSGMLTGLAPVSYREGKQFLIPLEIPLGVEREAVLVSLYKQVVEISQRLINQRI